MVTPEKKVDTLARPHLTGFEQQASQETVSFDHYRFPSDGRGVLSCVSIVNVDAYSGLYTLDTANGS